MTYCTVEVSPTDGDDGVIVINGSPVVRRMAKEICGGETLSWALVLSGSEDDGQRTEKRFKQSYCDVKEIIIKSKQLTFVCNGKRTSLWWRR